MNGQSTPNSQVDFENLLIRLQSLKLPALKVVAKNLLIAQSGRKADVQDRIKSYIQIGKDANDHPRLLAISDIVSSAAYGNTVTPYDQLYTFYSTHNSGGNATSKVPSDKAQHRPQTNVKRPWLFFRENPFFVLRKLVTQNAGICHKAPSGRGTCRMTFTLSETDFKNLKGSGHFKLFLLSGVYDPKKSSSDALLEFPHPLEIHFNGTLVKDNVKGLKNKPGTARPANLTPYIRGFNNVNELQLVYAFTNVDHLVFIYLVEEVVPEKILLKICDNPHILKQATLNEFNEDEQDEDDLQEMSTRLSLKCPLSFTRMKNPIKSIYCNHLPCFDALSFIYLQEQAPTWSCPICYKPVRITELAINDYVKEILDSTAEEVETVEIDLDGSWKPIYEEDENSSKAEKKSATPFKKEATPTVPSKVPNSPIIISLDSDDDDIDNDDVVQQEITQIESDRTQSEETRIQPHVNDKLTTPPQEQTPLEESPQIHTTTSVENSTPNIYHTSPPEQQSATHLQPASVELPPLQSQTPSFPQVNTQTSIQNADLSKAAAGIRAYMDSISHQIPPFNQRSNVHSHVPGVPSQQLNNAVNTRLPNANATNSPAANNQTALHGESHIKGGGLTNSNSPPYSMDTNRPNLSPSSYSLPEIGLRNSNGGTTQNSSIPLNTLSPDQLGITAPSYPPPFYTQPNSHTSLTGNTSGILPPASQTFPDNAPNLPRVNTYHGETALAPLSEIHQTAVTRQAPNPPPHSINRTTPSSFVGSVPSHPTQVSDSQINNLNQTHYSGIAENNHSSHQQQNLINTTTTASFTSSDNHNSNDGLASRTQDSDGGNTVTGQQAPVPKRRQVSPFIIPKKAPKPPLVARSVSNSNVTSAQSNLKSRLDAFQQQNGLNRANTVNLPVNKGNSKALASIQGLQESLKRSLHANGTPSTVHQDTRTVIPESNHEPSRQNNGTSSISPSSHNEIVSPPHHSQASQRIPPQPPAHRIPPITHIDSPVNFDNVLNAPSSVDVPSWRNNNLLRTPTFDTGINSNSSPNTTPSTSNVPTQEISSSNDFSLFSNPEGQNHRQSGIGGISVDTSSLFRSVASNNAANQSPILRTDDGYTNPTPSQHSAESNKDAKKRSISGGDTEQTPKKQALEASSNEKIVDLTSDIEDDTPLLLRDDQPLSRTSRPSL